MAMESCNFCPEILGVVKEICDIAQPDRVILFSVKRNLQNHVTSFKLCAIVESNDKTRLEQQLYLLVDCDLPYDILLYTPNEWKRLTADPYSFASKIEESGCVVYG